MSNNKENVDHQLDFELEELRRLDLELAAEVESAILRRLSFCVKQARRLNVWLLPEKPSGNVGQVAAVAKVSGLL
jgi:hypothetical protein